MSAPCATLRHVIQTLDGETHLHFDGPMIAGGLGYSVEELLASPAPATFHTGVDWIDQLTGGIEPGSVWTVMGPTGVGVTTFVTRLAAASARSSEVILANGHLPSRHLAALVQKAAQRDGGTTPSTPRVASWLPLPDVGDDSWDSACEHADVVVLDTWDEMWRPDRWRMSREERIADVRWLREVARSVHTAVVLTARRPRVAGPGPGTTPRHWAEEAFDDVADVSIELGWGAGSAWRLATLRSRSGGSRRDRLPFH